MESTLEELADLLVSLMPQYAQDYVFINDWLDEPPNPWQVWAHIVLKEEGSYGYCVAWGIFSKDYDLFEGEDTIRGAIEVAIKEIKRTHGIAEEQRRELLDEEAEC